MKAEATIDAIAEMAAEYLYHWVICHYRCFVSLQSNPQSYFMNASIYHLMSIIQVNHYCSAPYYPHNNGLVERIINTLKPMFTPTCLGILVHY